MVARASHVIRDSMTEDGASTSWHSRGSMSLFPRRRVTVTLLRRRVPRSKPSVSMCHAALITSAAYSEW